MPTLTLSEHSEEEREVLPAGRECDSNVSMPVSCTVPSSISNISRSSCSVSNNSLDSFDDVDKKFNTINFVYTNARSLPPKIGSLIEIFDNYDLHFAAVSETWMTDGKRYEKNVQKLESKENLRIIARNRNARGGGVAIIFNKSRIDLKPLKIKNNKYELVGAIGRTKDCVKKLLVLSAYLPPQMKKNQVDDLNLCISDTIDSQKNAFGDLQVVLCGDFNKKNMDGVLVDHPDIRVLDTPTTRGGEVLDMCLTNATGQIDVKRLMPLHSETGQSSDHYCMFVRVINERKHDFVKTRFSFRPFTEEASVGFTESLAAFDWANIHGLDVNEAVTYMNGILNDMYIANFPEKTKTIKSTDPRWLSRRAKRATEKKRKYFRKHKKNAHWKRLDAQAKVIVNEEKEAFLERTKKGMLESKNSAAFFKSIKALSTKETTKPWDIRSLFPGESDSEIADKCVEYFSSISREYEPLARPDANGEVTWTIPLHEISSKLRHCKKPKGVIEGDIKPELVKINCDLLAVPLHYIYNRVIRDCCWPDQWKLEKVRIIPKHLRSDVWS